MEQGRIRCGHAYTAVNFTPGSSFFTSRIGKQEKFIRNSERHEWVLGNSGLAIFLSASIIIKI
jgi:hypothetical protein